MAKNFEEWLAGQNIGTEAQQAILENITDNPTQEQLIEDENNHIPDVFTNWKDLHDGIKAYRQLPETEYGENGTKSSVTNLIAYKSAKETDAAFFDISYVQYDKSGKNKKEVLDDLLDDIETTASKTLMLGQLEVHKDDGSFNGETLEALLESEKLKAFDTVIMPVALSEKKDGENHRHTVSLILHKGEAMLIDQGGKDPYPEDKENIKALLEEKGINLSYESDFIMTNRMDCAIFASMINKQAATDLNGLQEYIDTLRAKKEETEKAAEVDNFNRECKTSIVDTYAEIFANSPLFKAYLKAKGLDFSTLSVDEKMEQLRIFNGGGELNVNENELDDDRISDPAWKEEVRKAVKEANEDKNRSAEFEEYKNDEHPDHLFFKDKNNDKNIIAFASKEQAYVEGEQAAFDHLALTAKKLGKDTINFGKFEKHPEYKAMLYLACLKHGLEMKGNVPTEEELRSSGQYAEIQKIKAQQEAPKKREELRNRLKETKNKYSMCIRSAYMEPKFAKASKSVEKAKENYNQNPSEENKKALNAAQQALEATEAYKEVEKTKKTYLDTLKEATQFYIEYGSGKPGDKSTPEERRENLERHTQSNEKGIIEREDKTNPGKTEKLKTFSMERLAVKNILQASKGR